MVLFRAPKHAKSKERNQKSEAAGGSCWLVGFILSTEDILFEMYVFFVTCGDGPKGKFRSKQIWKEIQLNVRNK